MGITMRVVLLLCCITLTYMTPHQAGAAVRQGTGKIKGVLLDHTEARIVYATITFENEKLNRKVYPNGDGEFEISLPAGFYRFSVQSHGFKTFDIDSFEIKAESIVEMKVPMEVGPPERPHPIEVEFERLEPQYAPIGKKISPRKIL
jgi:hypothetical protein